MSLPPENSSEAFAAGLADAQATVAELWRRHDDDEMRKRAMQSLRALISAEATVRAADAFLLAKTLSERRKTYEALRAVACLRLGHDTRRTP